MSAIECAGCGLVPFDLPDGIDPEFVFERHGGDWYCQGCLPERSDDEGQPLPLHRTAAGYPHCSTCDGGGCPDCTDPA